MLIQEIICITQADAFHTTIAEMK